MKLIFRITLFLSLFLNVLLTGFILFRSGWETYWLPKLLILARQRDASFVETNEAFVFMGDSQTARNDWSHIFKSKTIYNLGVSGHTIANVYKRVKQVEVIQPRKLFLEVGINDLRYGSTIEATLIQYEQLIIVIQKKCPQTQILVQNILPLVDGCAQALQANNIMIATFNMELKKLAEAYRLTYINLFDAFAVRGEMNKELSYDGLHLNQQGYRLWGQLIGGFIYTNPYF